MSLISFTDKRHRDDEYVLTYYLYNVLLNLEICMLRGKIQSLISDELNSSHFKVIVLMVVV